jgi:hypothetical protein
MDSLKGILGYKKSIPVAHRYVALKVATAAESGGFNSGK